MYIGIANIDNEEEVARVGPAPVPGVGVMAKRPQGLVEALVLALSLEQPNAS